MTKIKMSPPALPAVSGTPGEGGLATSSSPGAPPTRETQLSPLTAASRALVAAGDAASPELRQEQLLEARRALEATRAAVYRLEQRLAAAERGPR